MDGTDSDLVVVVIESYDRDLIRGVYSIGVEGTEYVERLRKAGFDPALLKVILHDGPVFLLFLERLLKLIESHTKGKKNRCKTKIQGGKQLAEIRKLLAQFEKTVDASIDDDDDDGEVDDDLE